MHRVPIPDLGQNGAVENDSGEVEGGSAGFPARHDNPIPDHHPT